VFKCLTSTSNVLQRLAQNETIKSCEFLFLFVFENIPLMLSLVLFHMNYMPYILGRMPVAGCGLLLQIEWRGLCFCLLVTFVSRAKAAEPVEMLFWQLTCMAPRSQPCARCGPGNWKNLWLFRQLKSIVSHCCVVRCKKINNGLTASLLLRTAMLLMVILRCSPMKNLPPCNAVFHLNSLLKFDNSCCGILTYLWCRLHTHLF